jgi:hypothetical protein
VAALREPDLAELGSRAVDATRSALLWAEATARESQPALEAGARRFALTLARSFALALLVEQAEWARTVKKSPRASYAAARFAAHGVAAPDVPRFDAAALRRLALGST